MSYEPGVGSRLARTTADGGAWRRQTAVAVQRLGLLTQPAAPQRLRVGPRITLGIPLDTLIGGIAKTVIGAKGY